MPRAMRSRQSIQIDLFPFLSILACTIGSLILLIIVLTSEIIGSQKQVTIVAKSDNGLNRSKQPLYIECQADGVILHPKQVFVAASVLESEFSPLGILLKKIDPSQEYLIVVVRPDGIDTFKRVRSLVEGRGIDIGYEPLDKDWKLNIKSEANN
ncbi:MAG: hypothetical protein ACK507_01465 [bacterium]|jgi:hypothetical protein|uniref:hypothetical protein n=1 Tax=Microcystis sp. TaxID=1127 RepID=UPI00391CC867